ncbi:hypothetical protein TanjilG_01296 [Lupinus angustifolius]|uniref:RING-type domain-containing protein n=1 Tax=Lupinus angustifolius TaxID=3871 RepID=A0A4P1REW4_LUPAN|nr:PREDICTED: uncharacterized protein LOC109350592 [Lupinus angustifolius]OIW09325.1 hypothetical protein TanjilG_01296 [Lupinus angustifolius]
MENEGEEHKDSVNHLNSAPFNLNMLTANSHITILPSINTTSCVVDSDVAATITSQRTTALSSMKFAATQISRSISFVDRDSLPPAGNHGQSQVVGSIQQSNSPIRPYSTYDLRIQTGKGNMASQVSRPSIASSLKRSASQPPPSTVQGQRRKTVPTHPFIQPSIPTQTRLAPEVLNTPQAIPPLIHAAQSLTPHHNYSSGSPIFPTTQVQSALSALNISQTVHPLVQTSPFVAPHDNRIPSLHPSSHTPPLPNQQLLALSQVQQRLRAQIISSASNISLLHIKYTDETPEPIGHKCFLCKRDLSYRPEGPIFQPAALPAAAVLPCGHTFHEQCLERITPDDHCNDPPCIPCALGN